MLLETLLVFLAAAEPITPPAFLTAPAVTLGEAPPLAPPAYKAERRAVDNWRLESALALDLRPAAALARALGADAGEPPRCVKLNNYWCVKRAGWTGEIAADGDGHVAFASAEEGAAVAALLLRRYYVDYKRHSARAIAERWAPAQCGLLAAAPRPGAPVSRAGMANMLPQRIVPMGLAPRGIQNTARARWLAAHGRGGIGAPLRRADRDTVADLLPAPSIMEGGGETPHRRRGKSKPAAAPRAETDDDVAAISLPSAATPPGRRGAAAARMPPVVDCSAELVRISNYATHIGEGVVRTPDDDLGLFTPDGRPTDNLARVMANMAAVEIGPARPRAALVSQAVAQLRATIDAQLRP